MRHIVRRTVFLRKSANPTSRPVADIRALGPKPEVLTILFFTNGNSERKGFYTRIETCIICDSFENGIEEARDQW